MSKQKQEGVPSALSELECPQISCGRDLPKLWEYLAEIVTQAEERTSQSSRSFFW